MLSIFIFILVGVTAYTTNLSLEKRHHQWFIPTFIAFIFMVIIPFYLMGYNGVVTGVSLIDGTSKLATMLFDQKSIEIKNIYFLSIVVILLHTLFLNFLKHQESNPMVKKMSTILSWVAIGSLFLLFATRDFHLPIALLDTLLNGTIEVDPRLLFLIAYIYGKYLLLMMVESLKVVPMYKNLSEAFPFYQWIDDEQMQLRNRYVPIGYYLFLSSAILYAIVMFDVSYHWELTGLFLIFGIAIIFELSIYLSAPFAQYNSQEIATQAPPQDSSDDLRILFQEYSNQFENQKKLFNKTLLIEGSTKQQKVTRSLIESLSADTQSLYQSYKSRYSKVKEEYFEAFDHILNSFDEEKKDQNANVLVKNSFAYEYEPYLAHFLHYLLEKEKNTLFIFNTPQEQELTLKYLPKIFNSSLLSIKTMLDISHKREGEDDLKYTVIADTAKRLNEAFFYEELKHISLIVILHLDSTLDKYVIQTNLLLDKIFDYAAQKPSILAFSQSSSELSSSFHNQFPIVGSSITQVTVEQSKNKVYTRFFNAEGRLVKHKYTKNISGPDRISDLSALTLLALQRHVKLIKISSAGFIDIEDDLQRFQDGLILNHNSKDIGKTIYQHIEVYYPHYLQPLSSQDKLFYIDDRYNLASTMQKWASYTLAPEVFFIIVSPRYLLREYIRHYINFFVDSAYITDFILYGTLEDKMKAYILFQRLQSTYTSQYHIARTLNKRGEEITKFDIIEFLNRLLDLSLDEANILFKDHDIFENDEFRRVRNYKISIIDSMDSIDSKPYQLVAQNDGTHFDIEIGEVDIYTKYLPHQIHIFGNKMYKIDEIDDHKIRVIAQNNDEIPQYRIKKEFFIRLEESKELLSQAIEYGKASHLQVTHLEHFGGLHVDTQGYHQYYAEGSSSYQKVSPKKSFSKGSIFQIDIRREEGFSDAIRFGFVALLNEILYTLFPNSHHLVDIMTHYLDEDYDTMYFPKLTLQHPKISVDPKRLSLFIVESTELNIGLHKTFLDNFNKILEIIDDYLVWLIKNESEDTFVKDIKLGGVSIYDKFGKELEDLQKSTLALLRGTNDLRENRKDPTLNRHSHFI